MAVPLEVLLLGPLQVPAVGAVTNGLGASREQALLVRLAMDAGRVVSMERLIDDLFGSAPPATARNTLQVHVSRLRRRIGAGRVHFRGTGYALLLEPDQVDVHRFTRLTAAGAALRRQGSIREAVHTLGDALDLWRGEPLGELTEYLFARTESTRLKSIRGAALEELAEALLSAGRPEDVVGQIAPSLARYPFRERLRATVMTALYRCGQAPEALAAYQAGRQVMDEELGLEPGPALKALHLAILNDDPVLVAAAPGAQAALALVPAPSPATLLLGRTAEMAALSEAVQDPAVRLVTLMGPGGAGKTRLALELAAHPPDVFSKATLWVSLVGLDNPGLVLPAIGTALGLPTAKVGMSQIAETLRFGSCLLLVDNAEHLLPDLGLVLSDLLAACPAVTMLVTSRAALHLAGEHRFLLGPLPVPGRGATMDELFANPSVELFVTRARQVRPSFRLADTAAPAVAGICRRLDGLPLALELAAARCGLFEPSTMLARLESRLDVLTAGPIDAPDRHRSLRATLDWSYRLLSGPARSLLARLATFRGDFNLDAVEFVAARRPRAAHEQSAGDTMQELLDASLVASAADRDGRFILLETILEYAEEKLRESGDEEEARAAHCEYFRAALLARSSSLPIMPETVEALAWLPVEQENVRAATQWAQTHNDVCFAEMVVRAAWYWDETGQWAMLEPWLLRVARSGSGVHACDAEYRLSIGVEDRGRLTDAIAHIGRARSLLADLDDPDRSAIVLASQAILVRYLKPGGEAIAAAAATQLAQAASTPRLRAWLLVGAAVAMLNDDRAGGHALLLQARDAAVLAGNKPLLQVVTLHLADVVIADGDWDEGLRWCREGLRLAGSERHRPYFMDLMAAALLLNRQLAQVQPPLQEAMRVGLRLNDQALMGHTVLFCAALHAASGDDDAAATLLGWHEAAYRILERPRYGAEVRIFNEFLYDLAERLGESRHSACLRRGAAMAKDQMVGWLLRGDVPTHDLGEMSTVTPGQ